MANTDTDLERTVTRTAADFESEPCDQHATSSSSSASNGKDAMASATHDDDSSSTVQEHTSGAMIVPCIPVEDNAEKQHTAIGALLQLQDQKHALCEKQNPTDSNTSSQSRKRRRVEEPSDPQDRHHAHDTVDTLGSSRACSAPQKAEHNKRGTRGCYFNPQTNDEEGTQCTIMRWSPGSGNHKNIRWRTQKRNRGRKATSTRDKLARKSRLPNKDRRMSPNIGATPSPLMPPMPMIPPVPMMQMPFMSPNMQASQYLAAAAAAAATAMQMQMAAMMAQVAK